MQLGGYSLNWPAVPMGLGEPGREASAVQRGPRRVRVDYSLLVHFSAPQ